MAERNVVIKNETGLHARPAASLVQFVKNYPGDVKIIKDGKEANAKSIFNVMSLGIAKGTEIKLIVEGEDEDKFADELVEFIDNLSE
ncbi:MULTISPECIES: HPr family phosphocarrier protein [Anaerococcus]|uniref:Phosphocarrier protein HPr n=1 Tax=Anaerococcus nagyae TaxID=1755241 RepID=A0A3E2TIH1_9FIRM|nr:MULTISPECIES: HPr family phosphocarrier protein [Anaerococcus]MBP2069677.1 phosphocarrier protein HPr/phosphocarrier protein [Anaerococcus nagyae]MDU1829235.1 HPr family phosphocarrier protein [Anaerococcus sp.]MDU1863890.1 HPr family phosphocarrier protein [Anaerococcus sp.]MDU2354536.1 HPr family phosphocarrier protein [Anaerococcus sp.]MDU2565640.1 HPr family phosphocarrier protein [Anaerococcus sp.]